MNVTGPAATPVPTSGHVLRRSATPGVEDQGRQAASPFYEAAIAHAWIRIPVYPFALVVLSRGTDPARVSMTSTAGDAQAAPVFLGGKPLRREAGAVRWRSALRKGGLDGSGSAFPAYYRE